MAPFKPGLPVAFTAADAETAYETWGANCGPGAIAGVLGLTLDAVRPHLLDFDKKRYTNPTMMYAALDSLGVNWRLVLPLRDWPRYGLARIQWEGPWTAPGVPKRVAYGQTHWVGASSLPPNTGIFDINAINRGGWVSLSHWLMQIVPWLLADRPKATGKWHITHAIEITVEPAG